MKNLMKKIRRKRATSKMKARSPDPVTVYRAHLEIGIYTMLLDLIAKELETEQTVQTVPTAPAVPTVPTTAGIPAT